MDIPWSITPQEAALARTCIDKTLDAPPAADDVVTYWIN